jgi:hypothetical protein
MIKLLKMPLISNFLCCIFLISACTAQPPSVLENDRTVTDVEYSDDWKFITIYLDGAAAPKANNAGRAMTANNARRGFDCFEAVFYSEGSFTSALWEVGDRASIGNVHRTSGGTDYSAVSVTPSGSCAVLFAGRMVDKTLLAVGKIVSVDGIDTAIITDESVFVTFELSALEANTSIDPEKSSFLTSSRAFDQPPPENTRVSKANTNVINANIGERMFPLYWLPSGKSEIAAEYCFSLDGSDWSDYNDSIVVAGSGKTDKRLARYPAGNGKYWYPVYAADLKTSVEFTNNKTAGLFLENPLKFKLDTSKSVDLINTEDNGIFSFAFTIPVRALSHSADVELWHIRPAFMSYYYNIDTGLTENELTDKNNGGAVLLGVNAPNNFEIPAIKR